MGSPSLDLNGYRAWLESGALGSVTVRLTRGQVLPGVAGELTCWEDFGTAHVRRKSAKRGVELVATNYAVLTPSEHARKMEQRAELDARLDT
jgi:hypothetical protein